MMSRTYLFVFCMSLIFLAGCGGAKEGSLVTDQLSVGDCPTSSCAQGIANAADTKLVLTSLISNVMVAGSSLAEVSGECYPSLFPQNYFDLTLIGPTGNSIGITQVLPAGFVARCVNGRFYVPVNLAGRPDGNYTFTMQFVVRDEFGIDTRPAFKSVTSTLIKRPLPPPVP